MGIRSASVIGIAILGIGGLGLGALNLGRTAAPAALEAKVEQGKGIPRTTSGSG